MTITHTARMVQHVSHTLLLLHYMLLSKGASRRLADHLLDRPYSRDYFIAGIGRMAFTEPPAWLTDVKDLMTFEHAGNVAHELVGDVLNPDELNEVSNVKVYRHEAEPSTAIRLVS